MSKALSDYLDGTDPFTVANGARALDREAWLNGQISREDYERTVSNSDDNIFAERNKFRDIEEAARKRAGFDKLQALKDSWC